jgi:hypothetical protein
MEALLRHVEELPAHTCSEKVVDQLQCSATTLNLHNTAPNLVRDRQYHVPKACADAISGQRMPVVARHWVTSPGTKDTTMST